MLPTYFWFAVLFAYSSWYHDSYKVSLLFILFEWLSQPVCFIDIKITPLLVLLKIITMTLVTNMSLLHSSAITLVICSAC